MNEDHDLAALRSVDLNLLMALDALTRAGSVTAAAEQVGVTQSAMSHTLKRLRALFDDPLLVRGKGRMVLTPRAEALMLPLRGGLRSLARTLAEPNAFSPATAQRSFRIAAPDLFHMLVFPPLLRILAAQAPGIDLAIVPAPVRLADGLETGDVDLAIHPILLDARGFELEVEVDDALQRRVLLRDGFRCFAREGHPAFAGRRLSLKRYVELGHVLVSPSGRGPGFVDRLLGERGLERRVVLRVPQFAAAVEVVAQTDLVLTGPSTLARSVVGAGLVSRAVPLELPEHAIAMVWHPRFGDEPGHRWLRERLVEVAQMRPPHHT